MQQGDQPRQRGRLAGAGAARDQGQAIDQADACRRALAGIGETAEQRRFHFRIKHGRRCRPRQQVQRDLLLVGPVAPQAQPPAIPDQRGRIIGAADNRQIPQAVAQLVALPVIHLTRPGSPARLLIEVGADMAILGGLTGQRHGQPRRGIVAAKIARQMGNDGRND